MSYKTLQSRTEWGILSYGWHSLYISLLFSSLCSIIVFLEWVTKWMTHNYLTFFNCVDLYFLSVLCAKFPSSSNFPRWFWILFPSFNMLETSPFSIWNNTVSFSLLDILPETDHKAVTKPCAHVPCNPTISVSFYSEPLNKKRKRTHSYLFN